jgi:hypothetical protein
MLSQYGVGKHQGLYVDAPFMPINERLWRSDLSSAVFISPPDRDQGRILWVLLGAGRPALRG